MKHTDPKYLKENQLNHWQELPENMDPLPLMESIPYKTTGSRYGACGIRIDGTPEFIDAVLSNLKTLIDGESDTTRLELARREVETKLEIGGETKVFYNTADRAEVCYIRLHDRGGESKMANSFMRGIKTRNFSEYRERATELTRKAWNQI